jgi:serine/threonine-protein kinase
MHAGAFTIAETLAIAGQVLSALTFAHARGITHRDLKPSNLMLTPEGLVKVLDFGISKSNAEPDLTFPGTTLGSIHYMSPEQVTGVGIDARSDIYSLGAVLFEMLTGQRVFDGKSSFAVMQDHLYRPPSNPSALNPHVAPALSAAILKARRRSRQIASLRRKNFTWRSKRLLARPRLTAPKLAGLGSSGSRSVGHDCSARNRLSKRSV